jgi:lipoprotein-anchoring transpeptidase ErfK/SrfK
MTKARISAKTSPMFRPTTFTLGLLIATALNGFAQNQVDTDRVIISVRDQKMMLVQNGTAVATYPVSTSKYGVGDGWGTWATPTGFFQVAQKIGDYAPIGAVFHNRRWTGEVLQPNAPGRDPIVTRIIWLRGLEASNEHAYRRCIYIHGTPQEKFIGRPASYGCIRMKSSDVAALYNQLSPGAFVQIVPDRLPKLPKGKLRPAPVEQMMATTSPAAPVKPATIPERKARTPVILGSIVGGS